MSKLGQIFTAGVSNDIAVLVDDVANSGILDPVGTSAFQLQGLAVDAAKPNLQPSISPRTSTPAPPRRCRSTRPRRRSRRSIPPRG